MNNELPKPNTQALSWFYGEHRKGSLVLDAKYQRYPIWSIGQKCFLIDSLISQCPIPQVFINVKSEGKGTSRRTVYEVVDGQQRLRSIVEFMADEWPLISTAEKAYPVSDTYRTYIGKKYSELPGSAQDMIWNYPLAVQELRGWDDYAIRSLFRRLNSVVERLNKQELRHSQYFGEFVDAVEMLSQDAFWDDVNFFTRRDSQRMKDVEFVSELFALVIDGVQDGQATLDTFYANYDVVFTKRNDYIAQFRAALKSLRAIEDIIKNSRFGKKADFYALFGATVQLVSDGRPVDLRHALPKLKELHDALERDPASLSGIPSKYYQTVIEGPNKKNKRLERIKILAKIIRPATEGSSS